MQKVNFRWFLTVYVPGISSLLAAIGAKLICPHGGLQVMKAVGDEQRQWSNTIINESKGQR